MLDADREDLDVILLEHLIEIGRKVQPPEPLLDRHLPDGRRAQVHLVPTLGDCKTGGLRELLRIAEPPEQSVGVEQISGGSSLLPHSSTPKPSATSSGSGASKSSLTRTSPFQ